MKRIVPALAFALLGADCAIAQEATSGSGPLVLTVRPSRFGSGDEIRERQERLMRRAAQRDYAFRTICKGCGAAATGAPVGSAFFPLDALAAPGRSRQVPTISPEPEAEPNP